MAKQGKEEIVKRQTLLSVTNVGIDYMSQRHRGMQSTLIYA